MWTSITQRSSLISPVAFAAVLLIALLAPLPLRADPIAVTGGTVQVEVHLADARITFIGEDFLVQTGSDDFFTTVAFFPFPSGTTLDLGGVWRPTDLRGGEGVFNGVHYDELYFGLLQSGGTFVTPSFTLTGEGGLQTVHLPFTFNGFVTAFSSINAQPDDVVFAATLFGQGTARAAFFAQPPEPGFPAVYNATALPGADDSQLEYVFSPAPIPEPGALALLGTGVLLMMARRFKRGFRWTRTATDMRWAARRGRTRP